MAETHDVVLLHSEDEGKKYLEKHPDYAMFVVPGVRPPSVVEEFKLEYHKTYDEYQPSVVKPQHPFQKFMGRSTLPKRARR